MGAYEGQANTGRDRVTAQTFDYDDRTLSALADGLSAARCVTYERAAGDRQRGFQLYVWNVAVSSGFYGPLQAVEITLRNAVHRTMTESHGNRWFEDSTLLRPADLRTVDDTLGRLHEIGKRALPGQVVAELSFGFWVGLFANIYDETLWRTHLHRCFTPRPKKRHGLHDELQRLRTLRNRIAHHEPVFQRRLRNDYDRLLGILGLLSQPTRQWVEHHSRVPGLLATHPDKLHSY